MGINLDNIKSECDVEIYVDNFKSIQITFVRMPDITIISDLLVFKTTPGYLLVKMNVTWYILSCSHKSTSRQVAQRIADCFEKDHNLVVCKFISITKSNSLYHLRKEQVKSFT